MLPERLGFIRVYEEMFNYDNKKNEYENDQITVSHYLYMLAPPCFFM